MTSSNTVSFTPGPWLHNPYDGWRDICQRTGPNSCHVIATVSYSVDGEGDETDRANARLIAASPNLYEALEEIEQDATVPDRVRRKATAALKQARNP
jgi:hypothetical protein